ncbi:MAG: DUF4340 domain-containing protein, partial [Kofleriaceae bacterium]
KSGPRTFTLGGSVYGGGNRYVADQQSGKVYVLHKDLISKLEIGQSGLQLTDPRGFEDAKVERITLAAAGKKKETIRVTSGPEGQQMKTWGDLDTGKPNPTIANFIQLVSQLKPTSYAPAIKTEGLTPLITLTYKDSTGGTLGTLSLYKQEKPAVLPEGTDFDPANPPKGEVEYFVVTPRTRVAGMVPKDTAQRVEQDIENTFSDNPTPTSVDPKGNPFGKAGAAKPTLPGNPHAPPPGGNPHAPAMPGAGSAAPVKPTAPPPGKPAAPPKPEKPAAAPAVPAPAGSAGSAGSAAPHGHAH